MFDAKTRELRDECINAMKDCFFYSQQKNLPIFGVATSKYKLEDFVQTQKDIDRNNRSMPGEHFRLTEEDTATKNSEQVVQGLMRQWSGPKWV